MSKLTVTPWRRFGHDRLYVNLPDGKSAAWLDLQTNQVSILLDVDRDAVLDALSLYLEQRPPSPARPSPPLALNPVPPPVPPPGPAGASSPVPTPDLPQAAPSTPELPDFPARAPLVGWVPQLPAADVLPATFQPGPPPAEASDPVGTLAPGADLSADLNPVDDLARNPPGAALRTKIEELTPGFWQSLRNWLRGRPAEDLESWRKGLAGEETAANELERLSSRGWRVLHSIPRAEEVDIDHLLIGPGGVFTVNTKYHPGANIWVGDRVVKVRGQSTEYVPRAWGEARTVSTILSQACGFTVRAEPVLAFVAVRSLVVAPPRDNVPSRRVRAIRSAEFITFTGLPEVWSPTHVERIYTAARDRRNWSQAGLAGG
ncbi:NERD domain-containing protein [Frankia sp. AgB1.9]|nr:NERD domain-containing protein [Frankia sp. AgB1.9]MBL7487509.1 NERD domain-containing protein [Frankia sp. AgW1.1]MBL7547472.1 NERD domain-containing protein [Frankia sp. AgB1.9]MBL7618753.1 NERD domain-containing protein [Frankia sp. AgB1.8]